MLLLMLHPFFANTWTSYKKIRCGQTPVMSAPSRMGVCYVRLFTSDFPVSLSLSTVLATTPAASLSTNAEQARLVIITIIITTTQL